MKKISVILLIIFSVFLLTSCEKIKETPDGYEFIDLLYQVQVGAIDRAVVIDVRPLNDGTDNDYESGHVIGALNYQPNSKNQKEFIEWITSIKVKETDVFIYDNGNLEYKEILPYLQEAGYKHITVFTDGYSVLKAYGDFLMKIEEATGIDDCGC